MADIVFITNKEDLKNAFIEFLNETKAATNKDLNLDEKLDRRKAAKFLCVSYQTMHNWTKDGLIKEHGQGRKKFYLRPELIEAMKNNG